MMRSVDVYVKTLGPPVRSILYSIFTSKHKPPSLSLPLHLSLRSSSNTPTRCFSNVQAISNSPIYGIRNLFTASARAISSSTTAPVASVQPQQQQLQNQHSEEVDDEVSKGLDDEAKLSIPVRAYFFSTRYDSFIFFQNVI